MWIRKKEFHQIASQLGKIKDLQERVWKLEHAPVKLGEKVRMYSTLDGAFFTDPIIGVVGSVEYRDYSWIYGVISDGLIYNSYHVFKV
jgi:hypothetical protein